MKLVMASLRPRVAVFLLMAILICFTLVKEVHAEKCDQSLPQESCNEDSNPKVEIISTYHDSTDDDDDDDRDGNPKKLDEGGEDPDDDGPEIVVLGH